MTTTRFAWACGAAFTLALVSAPAARAQGNLSVNGLGFPPGQFSARAAGTAGALAELDPVSALNPSSILGFGYATLSVQMSPEYRKITSNGVTDNTSTQRFPLFVGAMPFGSRWMVALSASTLLDRTWRTTTQDAQIIGGDTVRFTSTNTSEGALNDMRLAVAYETTPWLRLGVGLHAMNGRNVLTRARTFVDTLAFGNTNDPRYTSYIGNAISAGATLYKDKLGNLAFSWRRGGHLEQTVIDSVVSTTPGGTPVLHNTVIGTGRIPDRMGASVSYNGLGGFTLVARTSLDKWSSLGSLDSFTGPAQDSWDTSVGAESSGQFAGLPLAFRVGGRWRNLPFAVSPGAYVREGTLAGGVGLALAQGHALVDIGVLRASRSAGIPVTESAWTLSLGITIRP
jgi:hypothetical protein